jgi:hypothetical protein
MFEPTFSVCCRNDERDMKQPTTPRKFSGSRGAARIQKSSHGTPPNIALKFLAG